MIVLDVIVALEILILIWQGWRFNQNEQEIITLLKEIQTQLPAPVQKPAVKLVLTLGQPFAQ